MEQQHKILYIKKVTHVLEQKYGHLDVMWKRSTQLFFTDTASVHMYPMKTETKALRLHYQFQSTPRNIRNLFKMADARFPFLSFILRLISDLIACFKQI